MATWLLQQVPQEALCFWMLVALLIRDKFHLAATFRHISATFGIRIDASNNTSLHNSPRREQIPQTPRSKSQSRSKYQAKVVRFLVLIAQHCWSDFLRPVATIHCVYVCAVSRCARWTASFTKDCLR